MIGEFITQNTSLRGKTQGEEEGCLPGCVVLECCGRGGKGNAGYAIKL
jgi:hypothetical protein